MINYKLKKEKLKTELQKFKGFWHKLMKHFQNRIGFDKDEKYKYVSDDLYKNVIFDSNDNEIANNIYRKVTIPDENKQIRNKRKKMIRDFNMEVISIWKMIRLDI